MTTQDTPEAAALSDDCELGAHRDCPWLCGCSCHDAEARLYGWPTTRDTPEAVTETGSLAKYERLNAQAALATALHARFCGDLAPHQLYSHLPDAAAILAAIPSGWCGHPDEYEEATAMAMNYGEGAAEGRKASEAEIARVRAALRDALLGITSMEYGKAMTHGEITAVLRAALAPSEP